MKGTIKVSKIMQNHQVLSMLTRKMSKMFMPKFRSDKTVRRLAVNKDIASDKYCLDNFLDSLVYNKAKLVKFCIVTNITLLTVVL